MRTSWQDALDFKVYISTDGDFVSLGDRREYPFTAGSGGIPAGWTMYNTAGSNPSDVNWTTQNGRFSISNALTTANSARYFGAYRDFPVTPGHYYIMQMQARRMDNKTVTQRNIRYEWSSGGGSGAYGTAYDDWEQVSIPCGMAPAGATYIRVIVQAVYFWGLINGLAPEWDPNWGAQFQNVTIIDQLGAYPEPTWDEVTCDVQNLSLRYGRDKFVSRYDVAQMSIGVLNNDGDFTYDPLQTLRPGRFIKLEANELGKPSTIYDQFYGIIDGLTDSFTLDGRALTVIQAVDVSSLLSNTTVPTATWHEQTYWSGPRFARLLDAVAWHPTMRSNMPGKYSQQAILANGRSVRDELGLIADSEGGYFFCDRSGIVTYKDRSWATPTNTRVTAELLAQEPQEPVLVPGVKFVFTAPPNGDFMTTPHRSDLVVTGDIEIAVRLSFSDMTTEIDQGIICKSRSATGAEWALGKNANTGLFNRPYIIYNNIQTTATAVLPYGVNQTFWLLVARRAGGSTGFYTAPDSDTLPTVWTQLGSTIASTATAMSGTSPIDIGMRQLFGVPASSFRGTMRRAIVRRGTGDSAPIIFDVRNTDALAAGPGATAFVSTSTHPITVNQGAGRTVVQDDTRYVTDLPVVDDVPNLPGLPIICVNELQTTWSRDRVVNEVSLANQGGSAFTTVDPESQRRYGPRTYQRMDFLNDNAHPEYLIERTVDIMDGYTDAIVRINSIGFRPTLSPEAYAWALSIWLNDLVRVRYTHPTEGWGFSVVSHVQGIEHSLTQNDWGMTLLLDEPEAFNYWNEATGAGWDVSEWDVDLWDADRADRVYWSSGQKWSEGHRWG